MATQYTSTLKLALPVTGELSGTWGDVVNDNITSMVEQAVAGLATINTWTANAHTLTVANGLTSESRCAMLVAATGGGAPTAAAEIICPAASKLYVLKNSTSYVVTLKTSAGTGIAVPVGQTAFLFCDGTNVLACVTTIVDGNISGNLTVGGNTTLGDATSDTITATARFNTDLVPSTDNARDLGSAANSWKDLYIDGTAYLALVDTNGGTIDGVSIGATTAATIVNVDNMRLDGNTLSSTDTNGNIVIAPNGTGDVQLDADTVRIGDSGATATLTTNGAGNLVLSTNSGTTSGTIVIANGANGDVTLTPDGTGDIILSADRTQFGDLNTDAILTTNGTGNLNLTTNNGTNSGTIQITQGVNGAITLTPNGTGVVSVPTIGVTGGTVNGVGYLNASKVLTTGSALTFDGANFGVGTSSPGAKLEVYSPGTVNLRLNGSLSGGNTVDFYNYIPAVSNDGFSIAIGGTNRLNIGSSGNLGIGTSSPAYKLDVTGQIFAKKDNEVLRLDPVLSTSPVYQRFTNSGGNSYIGLNNSAGGGLLPGSAYEFCISTESARAILFGTNNVTRLTLDASGNLGLGVTPSAWGVGSYKVFQVGIASFVGGATGAYLLQDNAYSDNTGATWKYVNSGYAAAQYYAASGSHVWRTAPSGTAGNAITFTQAMTLDSSGNLLVGTTAFADSNTNSAILQASNGTCAFIIQHDTGNISGNAYEVFNYNGSAIGSISQAGTTGVLYNITSDQRLKENIQDAASASALIDSLQVRQYDWKADGSHQRYGFVAQELVTVAPEAVHQPADPEEMMAVDYSKLVPMLVKEIQSLRARISALESK